MAKKQRKAASVMEITDLCIKKGYKPFVDYIPIGENKWGATHIDFQQLEEHNSWLMLRKLVPRHRPFEAKRYVLVVDYVKLNADDKRTVLELIDAAPNKD